MSNRVVEKAWGDSQFISDVNGVETYLIRVVAGGFCSIHRHIRKNNLFAVLRGELVVVTGDVVDGIWVQQTQLSVRPGVPMVVPAGLWHQFRAVDPVVALETYWVDAGGEDIVRFSEGGVNV